MSQRETATTATVTQINRTAILDALQERGPMSRAELRAVTGLSPSTIQRLCNALLNDNLVTVDRTVGGTVGRPTGLFRYRGEGRCALAVELLAGGARGALIDLQGSVVTERVLPERDGTRNGATPIADVFTIIDLLLEAPRGASALGIGISVPGVVADDGRVTNAPELGWHDVPLGDIISERYGLPLVVENTSNTVAFGEWRHGAAHSHSIAVALVLGSPIGVGAGIVANGRIIRGHRASAGEIGYLLTDVSALSRIFTMQGDLETRLAEAAGSEDGTTIDLLAMAVAALSTVLDPDSIVIADSRGEVDERTIVEIRRRLIGRIPSPPSIIRSALGRNAALIGVGELIARRAGGSVYLA